MSEHWVKSFEGKKKKERKKKKGLRESEKLFEINPAVE